GVRDDLAADQRPVHPDVAHRDAVGDRDRAELHREPAAAVHALLGRGGEPLQRQVARGDLVPAGGDADLGLREVLVAHPDRTQHPAGGRALQPPRDLRAARLEVRCHGCSSGVAGAARTSSRSRPRPTSRTTTPAITMNAATTNMPASLLPVRSRSHPVRYGPAKPLRLPNELITAMPAAAPTPVRNALGSCQNTGTAAFTPAAQSAIAAITR